MNIADISEEILDYYVSIAIGNGKIIRITSGSMEKEYVVECCKYVKERAFLIPRHAEGREPDLFCPSTDGRHAEFVISHYGISLWKGWSCWEASAKHPQEVLNITGRVQYGKTPLIAAMRALVSWKIGDELN
jgi:hypothetical protein